MERCIHNLIKSFCAYCRDLEAPKRALRRNERTSVHAAGALDGEGLQREGYAIVHPYKGRDKCGIRYLDEHTTFVHIDGWPHLWAIKEILGQAENLKTIQVIPSMYRALHPNSHLRLCKERGVRVIKGHARPEFAWEDGRIVSPHYRMQKDFLERLTGDQKALFDEVRAMGFEAALMTERYFCLNGEEYVTQRQLTSEYGFSSRNTGHISAKINSVLCYLDESFSTGEAAMRMAAAMRKHVVRLRPYLESVERRRRCAEKLGIPNLSPKFPLARLEVFKAILQARKSGRLDALEKKLPRDHRALSLRFGLDDLSAGVYRTLNEVGELMDGLTRERIRQLEHRALFTLGISEDE